MGLYPGWEEKKGRRGGGGGAYKRKSKNKKKMYFISIQDQIRNSNLNFNQNITKARSDFDLSPTLQGWGWFYNRDFTVFRLQSCT